MLVLKALEETGYILWELCFKKEPYTWPHEKCISLDDFFYYVHFRWENFRWLQQQLLINETAVDLLATVLEWMIYI